MVYCGKQNIMLYMLNFKKRVKNYFNIGLNASQANMGIQPVFNEFKAVAYMCQYFSKTEDQC